MRDVETEIGYSDFLFERIKHLYLGAYSYANGKNIKSINKILEKCCEKLEEVAYAIDNR